MKCYIIKKTETGLYLTPVEYNEKEFNIIPLEDGRYELTKKEVLEINVKENISRLKDFNFNKLSVEKVIIGDFEYENLGIFHILNQLYKLINEGSSIIRNSILNIYTIPIKANNYYYNKSLGISYPFKEYNYLIEEIFNQGIKNKIRIEILFRLENKKLLKLKI